MRKNITDGTIEIPKEEYKFLKKLYRTVKRQNFLLRIDEAEKNLKTGKVKKVSIDKFIESIWEMKPKYVSYDKAFEKKFEKYKSKLTDGGVYFIEIGSHDVCYWILFSCDLRVLVNYSLWTIKKQQL